jgi:hypothetical protein
MSTISPLKDQSQYNLIIKGSIKSLSLVNIFAAILGFILLFYWLNVRQSVGLNMFATGYAIIVIYLISDTVYWVYNGIHEVRITETYFEIIRGKANKLTKINGIQITDIQYSNQLSRRSLQILLGNKIQRIPGIFTWYPGPKIWLTSDAFDDSEFDKACDLIETMFAENQKIIIK